MRRLFIVATHALILAPLVYSSALLNHFIVPRQVWMVLWFVIAVGALMMWLWQNGARIELQKVDIAIGALLVITTITAVLGVDATESFWSSAWRGAGLLFWWLWFFWYLGARVIQWQTHEWRLFIVSHGVALVGTVLIVIVQLFNPEFVPLSNGDRPSGLIGNSIFLGMYAAPYVFLPWYVLAERKRFAISLTTRTKIMAVVVSISAVLVILMTQARASLLAIILGGAVTGVTLLFSTRHDTTYKKARHVVAVIAVCAVALFALLAMYGQATNSDKIKRLTFSSNYAATLKSRLVNWGVALAAARERPFTGWGFENYRTAVEKHYNPELAKYSFMETRIDKPHNVYIEWLVTTGIFGVLAWVALWFLLARFQLPPVSRALWLGAITASLVQDFFAFFTMQTIWMLGIYLLLVTDLRATAVREITLPPLRKHSRGWMVVGVVIFYLLASVVWYGVVGTARSAYYTQAAVTAQAEGDFLEIIKRSRQSLDVVFAGPYPFETWRWSAYALLTDAAARPSLIAGLPEQERIAWRIEVDRLARTTAVLMLRHDGSAHWNIFAGKILYHLALATSDAEPLAEAEKYFLRALALSPERQESMLMMMYVRAVQGDYAQSLDWLKRSSEVASDFEFINGVDFLARRLERQKEYVLLVNLYEWRAAKVQTAPAYAVLAAAYAAAGQNDKARTAVARAVAIDPSYAAEAELFLSTLPRKK